MVETERATSPKASRQGQYITRTARRPLGVEENEKGREERDKVRGHGGHRALKARPLPAHGAPLCG